MIDFHQHDFTIWYYLNLAILIMKQLPKVAYEISSV
jgi:hypothetical protein